jgi:nitroreductase/NAD-dependent dihydropyrimidine dehydrogenase PreA subunit
VDIIEVNKKTCLNDGICAASCPGGLISFKPHDYPLPGPQIEKACTKCGHCVAVCPTGSLNHREMASDSCTPIRESLDITIEQCEQLLKSRRSLRAIQNKPVPRDTIAKLIDIARYAPTGHNWQEVEWLVIDSIKELDRIRGVGLDWMRWAITRQPKIADALELERVLKRCENGVDEFLRNAPVLIFAHADKSFGTASEDCTSALTYLDLAAKSLGLGCCWAGFVKVASSTFPPMMEILDIPAGHIFGGMMLGYPRFRYRRIPLRKQPLISWR